MAKKPRKRTEAEARKIFERRYDEGKRLSRHTGVPLFVGEAMRRELFRKYGPATPPTLEDLEYLGYADPLTAGVQGAGPSVYWGAEISPGEREPVGYWVADVEQAMKKWRERQKRRQNPFYKLRVSASSRKRAIAQGQRFGRVVEAEMIGPDVWSVLVDQRRAAFRPNPEDDVKRRLLDWNPPPPFPVLKRDMHPMMILGQVGTQAVFKYRGWELEVKKNVPELWDVDLIPPSPANGRPGEYLSSPTFDGAICAGKITVDFWETFISLPDEEARLFRGVWRELQTFMRTEMAAHRDDPTKVRRPSRAGIARRVEVRDEYLRHTGRPRVVYEWWNSLPLQQRVRMIDDVMTYELCMYGDDPRRWPT